MSTLTADNEEILWSGSVSQWHYAGKWLVVLVLFAVLIASFVLHFLDDATTLWIVRGVVVFIALGLVAWIYGDRSRRKYTVSNRRVSVEFGLISKQSTELRVADIRSINLTTTGLSGLVGIGRLEFSSAASDDADVIFWNTPGAGKIRDLVRSLQTPTAS